MQPFGQSHKAYDGTYGNLLRFQQSVKSHIIGSKNNKHCLPFLLRRPVVQTAENAEEAGHQKTRNTELYYILLGFLSDNIQTAVSVAPYSDDGYRTYTYLCELANGTADANADAIMTWLAGINVAALLTAAEVVTANSNFTADAANFAAIDNGTAISPHILCYLYARAIILSARDEWFVNQILSDIRTNVANRTVEYWQAGYVAYRHTRDARDAALRAQEATVSALSITRGTGQARPLRQCPNKACNGTSHFTLARCPKSDQ